MYCNLIKEWSKLYLLSEGLSSENPDDYKADELFSKGDDYEAEQKFRNSEEFKKFMDLREKKITEDEDESEGDEEETKELDVMKEIEISKDNLIENLEKALENREERTEDEIKEVLTLLNLLDPEKLSDEDKALLNPPSDEEETTEVDSTEEEEVEKEEEK